MSNPNLTRRIATLEAVIDLLLGADDDEVWEAIIGEYATGHVKHGTATAETLAKVEAMLADIIDKLAHPETPA